MALDFITNNPTTDAYYKGQEHAERQGLLDQQLGVDNAVRQGITEMLQKPRQPTAYQSPAAAPVAAPAAPAIPAPAAAPRQPVNAVGSAMTGPPGAAAATAAPASDPNLGPSATQMRQMRVEPSGPDVEAIQQGMSRGATPPPIEPPATPPTSSTPMLKSGSPLVPSWLNPFSTPAAPAAAAPAPTAAPPPAPATPPPAPRPRPEASATPPAAPQLAMANPSTMTDASPGLIPNTPMAPTGAPPPQYPMDPTGVVANAPRMDRRSPGFIPPGTLGNPVEEAALNRIVQRESGGRNVPNQQGPGGTPLSTASGPFQDINSTWREGMQLVGLDPGQYQTAMSAPKQVQIAVNDALYKKYGEKPWAASEPGRRGAQPGTVVNDMGPVGPPGMAFMPGYNTSRYDPILQSLAATPGGGNAALKLLTEQGRFDQNNYRRTDAYQKLAMQALNHGDLATADFYAKAGGMQLPQSILSNPNNAVLLGRASLVAHQVYGAGNQQQAARYVQTYMANGGDVAGAFAAAGPPRENQQYQLKWVQDLDNTQKLYQVPSRGGGPAVPVMGQDNQPLTQGPKPSAASANLDYRIKLLTSLPGGPSYGDAVRQLLGGALRPGEVANAYRSFYNQQMATSTAPDPEKRAAVEGLMAEVYGPNWRNMMPGQTQTQGGTPQAAPQGAGGLPPAPAGAGAPSSYQPPSTAPPQPQAGTAAPQQAATPGQGGPMAAPTPQDVQQSIANARAAIAQGKPRAAVLKRLQDLNIPIPPDL